jgi:hypothetical protein
MIDQGDRALVAAGTATVAQATAWRSAARFAPKEQGTAALPASCKGTAASATSAQRTEPSDQDPRREEARLVRVSGVVRGRLDGSLPRARPALPAEIVAATVLCGELLLGSALVA